MSAQEQPAGTAPDWLVSRLRQIESAEALDQALRPLQSLAAGLLASRGSPMGSAAPRSATPSSRS